MRIAATLVAGFALASALLIGGAAPDAAIAKTKKAKSTDQGDFFATATIRTEVKRPKREAKIVAGSDRPGELVEVDWHISCTKRFRFETRDGGFSTTAASAKRNVKLPIRNAKSCSIRTSADWDIFDEPGFDPRPTKVTVKLRVKQRRR